MVQRARVTRRCAALHTNFARSFVERRFGAAVTAAVYEAFPTFQRGPRKGLVKGYVHWLKCLEGGWYAAGQGGHVVRPGISEVCLRTGLDTLSTQIIYAGQQPENTSDKVAVAFLLRAIKELWS